MNENINGGTNEAILPALSGTYSLKFRDLGGRFSETEAKVELALPEMVDELLVKSQREQTSFSGTKTNVTVSSGALQLSDPASNLTGTYEFGICFRFWGCLSKHKIKKTYNKRRFFCFRFI